MSIYRAEGMSRKDIRAVVKHIKQLAGLQDVLYFPVVLFLENILPVIFPSFQLEIVPVEMMGNKHGETIPSKCLIRIREDIYERAVTGEGRDRLTVAHEIGHLFLHEDSNVALCRLEQGEKLPAYEDPEWQADAFGGELLASSYLIKNMTCSQVQTKCGVSAQAAKVQLRALSR